MEMQFIFRDKEPSPGPKWAVRFPCKEHNESPVINLLTFRRREDKVNNEMSGGRERGPPPRKAFAMNRENLACRQSLFRTLLIPSPHCGGWPIKGE